MDDTTILARKREEIMNAIIKKRDAIIRGTISKFMKRNDWTIEELLQHDVMCMVNYVGDETYMIDGVELIVFFSRVKKQSDVFSNGEFGFEMHTTINYKVLI